MSNDPTVLSQQYLNMQNKWHLMNDVMEGECAIKAKGEEYLPRYDKESKKAYDARLQGARFINKTKKTLGTLTGKPFSEPVFIHNAPEDILSKVIPDVDLQGNDLDVFAKDVFKAGLTKGICHVLIEYPRLELENRTASDDVGLRPYWVIIQPENLLGARREFIGGREVLTMARLLETYTVEDGFAEIEKQRVRVLRRGYVEIYEPLEKENKDIEWIKTDEWETGLQYIPLVTYYADRTGFMLSEIPLEELARINLTHYQSGSDQRNILSVSRFPILAGTGISEEESNVEIGPNKLLHSDSDSARFYYVEHTGSAIEQGWKDIEKLNEEMQSYGAQFLTKKSGSITATEKVLDTAEGSSYLSMMARGLEDAFDQILDITADWMNLPDAYGGNIEVVKNYTKSGATDTTIATIVKAREMREISREKFLGEMMRLKVLPEDFDKEANAEQLLGESADIFGRAFIDMGDNE